MREGGTARTALILHPPGAMADLLAAELRSLGYASDRCWPPAPGAADVWLVLVAGDEKSAALAVIADAPCPVIALLNNDSPESLQTVATANVQGLLVRPLQRGAIAAQLQLAAANHAYQRRLHIKVALLERTLKSRRQIEKATHVLATVRGLSQADAYEFLRRKSMRNRVSMTDTADRYLAGLEAAEDATEDPPSQLVPPPA
jgi:AmiR/NasT family two-component response regulator